VLRLGWIGTFVRTAHDDFDDVEGRGAIPIVHDQDITLTEARLSLDAGITKRFGAALVLPVRMVSTRIRYLDGSGEQVDLASPSPHHRNETLSGLGDPMVLGVAGWGPLTLRAGTTIPLGRTEGDPFAMPDVPHQHIQMGSGIFMPVLSVEASRTWAPWRLSGFVFTQQALYENSHGYLPGDRYAAGVSVRRPITPSWGIRIGLEAQAETREKWNGVIHEDEGNQGRIDAMFAGGVSWSVTDALTLDVALKAPFVTHVVGGQLDMPVLADVGVSYAFGKPKAKHHDHGDDDHEHGDEHDHEHADEHDHEHGDEHDHEHGDEHADGHDKHAPIDTTGADVADIGHKGARVDLIPVAGKITIFDFWAEWCVPCKTLEPVLVEIAKANPDGIAVRRIDAVDWESAVVAQHLTPGGWNLPHVKIYDAAGKLIYEDSSGPGKLQAMIATIRAKVGATAPGDAEPAAARHDIVITERGFEPADVVVPRDVPVTLSFERKIERTCATELNFVNGSEKVHRDLPLNQRIELTVTFKQPGVIRYTCDMDMIGGTITVR